MYQKTCMYVLKILHWIVFLVVVTLKSTNDDFLSKEIKEVELTIANISLLSELIWFSNKSTRELDKPEHEVFIDISYPRRVLCELMNNNLILLNTRVSSLLWSCKPI